jgi:hypothetical protein
MLALKHCNGCEAIAATFLMVDFVARGLLRAESSRLLHTRQVSAIVDDRLLQLQKSH